MLSKSPGQSCGQSQFATAAMAIATAVLIFESGSRSPAGRALRMCALSALLVSAGGTAPHLHRRRSCVGCGSWGAEVVWDVAAGGLPQGHEAPTWGHEPAFALDPVLLDVLLQQHGCQLAQVSCNIVRRCQGHLHQHDPEARLLGEGRQLRLCSLDALRIGPRCLLQACQHRLMQLCLGSCHAACCC